MTKISTQNSMSKEEYVVCESTSQVFPYEPKSADTYLQKRKKIKLADVYQTMKDRSDLFVGLDTHQGNNAQS